MLGLRSFILFNNISQVELAQLLGVSKGQMSKLVSGTAKLQAEQLEAILSNDKGWNTEFLTNPIWAELESGKLIRQDYIEQNGGSGNIGKISGDSSAELAALRKEIDFLRSQLEELKKEKSAYWELIQNLTNKH